MWSGVYNLIERLYEILLLSTRNGGKAVLEAGRVCVSFNAECSAAAGDLRVGRALQREGHPHYDGHHH